MSIYGHMLQNNCIQETFKDMKDGGPYGKSLSELKTLIKNLFKKKVKEDEKKKSEQKMVTVQEKLNNLSSEEKKEFYKKMKTDWNKFISDLKECYKILKSQKDFKEKCTNSSKEINDTSICGIGDIPVININEFEELCEYKYGFEGIIEVIDDDQIIRIFYSWILYDIVKIYREKYPEEEGLWGIDYGDGDEGCLYVDYDWLDYFKRSK